MPTASDSAVDTIVEILEEAIEREQLSQRRYAMGASLAPDPEVKEMFLRLVEEEMSHERTLRERLVALKAKDS